MVEVLEQELALVVVLSHRFLYHHFPLENPFAPGFHHGLQVLELSLVPTFGIVLFSCFKTKENVSEKLSLACARDPPLFEKLEESLLLSKPLYLMAF